MTNDEARAEAAQAYEITDAGGWAAISHDEAKEAATANSEWRKAAEGWYWALMIRTTGESQVLIWANSEREARAIHSLHFTG